MLAIHFAFVMIAVMVMTDKMAVTVETAMMSHLRQL